MLKKRKNKRGLSVVIGYVLLITFGIILSVIVYNYLKTYVPSETTQCPAGVSIFLKDYNYNCSSKELNLTLKNNGKFNIEGYFIRATNSSSDNLATINLDNYFNFDKSQDGRNATGVVYFHKQVNVSLKSNEDFFQVFDLDKQIYSIELIPIRFQKEGSTQKFVSCGDAKVREVLTCS